MAGTQPLVKKTIVKKRTKKFIRHPSILFACTLGGISVVNIIRKQILEASSGSSLPNDPEITSSNEDTTSLYHHPHVNYLDEVEQCTQDQMTVIEKHLGLLTDACRLETSYACGIRKRTNCPSNTWLQEYYRQDFTMRTDNDTFLGLSIGCNKGYDAINTARMGMNDPRFDKAKWKEAISKTISSSGVCRQANDPQVRLLVDAPVRSGEMHCVEPMPSTSQVLQYAKDELGLDRKEEDKGQGGGANKFIITRAAVSAIDGTVTFPSAVSAGIEHLGLESCKTRKHCEEVPMYSLQTYVDKFVESKGPINILSIDVEGYDFDVLFGAGSVLHRVEYLEFEYHESGTWKDYHLMDAVRLLNRKGFTCYWAGDRKLWRLTGCDHEAYKKWHGWSNVACVHRSQKVLATKMEGVFLDTLK